MTDRGSVPIEFALAIGVLLLPVVFVVALVPTWVEHRAGARVAAAEAARLIATGNGSAGTDLAAVALAIQIADNFGVSDTRVSLCSGGVFDESSSCGRVGRGEVVEVEVSVLTPVVEFPMIGTFGGIWISASHSEQVDLYRSLP